jgi:hypothetical protein
MIRFELDIADPRAISSIFRGNFKVIADTQSYAIPFDSDFEADISHFYQSVVAVIWQIGNHNGTFWDETEEIEKHHRWSLQRSTEGEILFQIFQSNRKTDQKTLVLEYEAPWLSFILDFSKISKTNDTKGLWDTLVAWNTLRRRAHKKPISSHAVLVNIHPELCKLFGKVTYPAGISKLCDAPYLDLIGKQTLKTLQLKNEHVLLSITPIRGGSSTDYLEVAWQLSDFPPSCYRIKINWNNVDEVSASGEDIKLLKDSRCVLAIPKTAFAHSEYADYAEDYRHYFVANLYDSWFHQTQYWK